MDVSGLQKRLGMPAPAAVPWVPLAVVTGLILAVPHLLIDVSSIGHQVLRDGLFLVLLPMAVATAFGRRLGWRIDRLAVRNALALTAFVLPFYLVGSSLPSVRAAYPMWPAGPTFGGFLPHALGLVAIVIAAETFYRGLLCVSVREIGLRCVFISPIIYVIWHLGDPPIELLLAAPADVLFGYVDYRSRSVFPSVVAHATGFTLLSWLVMVPPLFPPSAVVDALSWVPGIPA